MYYGWPHFKSILCQNKKKYINKICLHTNTCNQIVKTSVMLSTWLLEQFSAKSIFSFPKKHKHYIILFHNIVRGFSMGITIEVCPSAQCTSIFWPARLGDFFYLSEPVLGYFYKQANPVQLFYFPIKVPVFRIMRSISITLTKLHF